MRLPTQVGRRTAVSAVALDTLAGAMDYRLLFWRAPVTVELATGLVDLILPGIRPAGGRPAGQSGR